MLLILNLHEHQDKEEIIEYISSKQYDNAWWKLSTPTIHPIYKKEESRMVATNYISNYFLFYIF